MQNVQGRRLQSLFAIQQFLDDHHERFPEIAACGARLELDALLVQMEAHAIDQATQGQRARGATRSYHALRRSLVRDHLAPICAIARTRFVDGTDFLPFHLPRGNPDAGSLKSYADTMVSLVAPYADAFIAAGLPRDFRERLRAASDAMFQAYALRSTREGERIGATVGLRAKLSEGRKIAVVLDRLIRSAAHDEPALLARWSAASRVRPVGRSTAKLPSASSASPAPLPAPTSKLLVSGAPSRDDPPPRGAARFALLMKPLRRLVSPRQ